MLLERQFDGQSLYNICTSKNNGNKWKSHLFKMKRAIGNAESAEKEGTRVC